MPPDSAVSADVFFEENGLFEALVARLPDDARGSFTEAQFAVLRMAAQQCNWGNHTVDIRFSLPLLIRRYYMVLICGRERRNKVRRAMERKQHPVRSLTNVLFLASVVAVSLYCSVMMATWVYIAFSSYCL